MSLFDALHETAPGLNETVLRVALTAAHNASEQGVGSKQVLAVIDYSRPSTEKRLWVFDLASRKLLFNEHVAHGKNSGENFSRTFSNTVGSEMSSIGLFVTGATYQGKNGLSLRLEGLDKGFNDSSMERAIVMHGADYVNPAMSPRLGRLGRSQGCPAVRREVAKPMIEALQGGALLFSWYPDPAWLASSRFLQNRQVLAD